MARSPEAVLILQLSALSGAARLAVLARFRGIPAVRLDESWHRVSDEVRAAIVAGQTGAIGAVGDYLSGLVGAMVPVDSAPWVGRYGQISLDEWLAITPRAHAALLASGVTSTEAAVATVTHLASAALSEPHRVGREATAVTAAADGRFVGWARVADPGACPWCRRLATRGAVYTEASVTRTFGGLRYHRSCRCIAKAVPMAESGPASRRIRRATVPAAA